MDNFDGLSDPFVDVYWRSGKGGEDHLVASTSAITDEENPTFPEIIEFSNYVPGSNQVRAVAHPTLKFVYLLTLTTTTTMLHCAVVP